MQGIKSRSNAYTIAASTNPVQKATTSAVNQLATQNNSDEEKQSFWNCCYNRQKKTCCGRTFKSWILIIVYGFMYLIFLGTFFMLCLYASLSIIKLNEEYLSAEKADLYAFVDNGIGLTAVPLSGDKGPIISYRSGEENEYENYVNEIDIFLNKNVYETKLRNKRSTQELGPCGERPYGYDTQPCVIVRINKQKGWSALPLDANVSTAMNVPEKVYEWLKIKPSKLWLYCEGIHPWDREHLGSLKYYPYPPGFDPGKFPLDISSPSPLVAIQFTNFTLGLSLSIHCKLFYTSGYSTLNFILYIGRSKTI